MTKYIAVNAEEYAALQAKCDRYEKALRDNYAADFIDYVRNERNSITKAMLSDDWWVNIPASKRVAFENVLIAYDQMVDRLSKIGVIIANEAMNGEWKGEKEPAPAVGWVKADTKPEHNVGVLVFIPGEDNHITSGMWDIENKWVLLDEYRVPEEEVTHWMPLPGLPEGVETFDLPDEIGQEIKKLARKELGLDESAGEKEVNNG